MRKASKKMGKKIGEIMGVVENDKLMAELPQMSTQQKQQHYQMARLPS